MQQKGQLPQNITLAENSYIRSAFGESSPVKGRGLLSIQLGQTIVQHNVWVAHITDDVLLGANFFAQHNSTPDLINKCLQICEEVVPFDTSVSSAATQELTCCRVVIDRSVTIPPLSEAVIPGRITGPRQNSSWGLVEPGRNFSCNGVVVGKTLVDVSGNCIPVRLMNVTRQRRRLRKGNTLGHVESVCSVKKPDMESMPIEDPAINKDRSEIPDYLQDLYLRSCDGLSKEQRDSLRKFFIEFQDMFSRGNKDLGRTGIVKHTIHTGSAAPIRHRPRRLPTAKQDEALTEINKMYTDGIIEPSKSQWQRLLCLWKRKMDQQDFA
ncbi:uncharacterized protein [Ptychodera flava]|uniref:uncharacterized protein n=1 Tax=Ptychodera flava TaxID=63121 RepID=UPI00396A0693